MRRTASLIQMSSSRSDVANKCMQRKRMHAVQRPLHFALAGMSVTLVTKLRHVYSALWDDMVVAATGCQQLIVESWRHEPEARPDICRSDGCMINANGLHLNTSSWTIGRDHAKWAICCDQSIVCFGDLNRAETQLRRAGMALCLKDIAVSHDLEEGTSSKLLRPVADIWHWFRAHLQSGHRVQCPRCTC